MSTARATRAASVTELVDESHPHLARTPAHGTMTAEAHTAYGLTTVDETKRLQAVELLNHSSRRPSC